jgi:hypothetical protein
MNPSILSTAIASAGAGASPELDPAGSPFEAPGDLTAANPIDTLVFGRLKRLNIQPARLCSDAVFLRRAYLDAIGTLPTAQEAKTFLQDGSPTKRHDLIDKLLARDEFADYWAMKWGDVLRVKAEFPINLWPNGAQAYHAWIRASLAENKPYDRFVREMLTASGSNFRVPAVNFYRAIQSREPQGIAQAVALTFMGSRAEKWRKDQLADMAAFFSRIQYKSTGEWKEEIVIFDRSNAASQPSAPTKFPDGTPARIAADQDPREVFAKWLTSPKNPWFARSVVNRIWAWLLGRGIVHEPDDIRPDNPPKIPELLSFLEHQLVGARYDLKAIYRLVLESKVYQLSPIPRTKHPEAAANFAYYTLRRLDAEVLIDALCQITGTTEKYSSAVPEPFTYIPEKERSIALPDGSVTSSFLELFGRPARDTGLDAERNNRPTAGQRLHLLNSGHVQRKLEQGQLPSLAVGTKKPRDVVDNLYLTILSRYPTPEELAAVGEYTRSGGVKGREVVVDVAWALINSAEFTYRH